jgi:uncharacterized membrane protein SpoIIM required for sporulation
LADNAKTAKWFESRLSGWQKTAGDLASIEKNRSAPRSAVFAAVRAYPEMARDLAVARRLAPNGLLTKRLEQIYLHLHRTIFKSPTRFARELQYLFVRDAAKIVASLRWHVVCVTGLFFAGAACGAWLVRTYPELIALFASDQMIDTVSRGELWTDNLLNVFPSSLLAAQIFTNNIMVCIFALCLGVFYGLGTIYIIGMNGLMLGAVFAFTSQYGMADRLFEFIAAHGFVELSVIFVSGAAGISLGEALARPGYLTRAAAFHAATMQCAKLMVVCIVFLIGAGLIEGYVSPNPAYSLSARLTIGLAYFAVFVIVVGGWLDRFLSAVQMRRWARNSE